MQTQETTAILSWNAAEQLVKVERQAERHASVGITPTTYRRYAIQQGADPAELDRLAALIRAGRLPLNRLAEKPLFAGQGTLRAFTCQAPPPDVDPRVCSLGPFDMASLADLATHTHGHFIRTPEGRVLDTLWACAAPIKEATA
jgi:hypothetical protein